MRLFMTSSLFAFMVPLAGNVAAEGLVSVYRDHAGVYDGGLMIVAGLNVVSGVMIFLAPPPRVRAGSQPVQ